jgi:hypothetical protein
MPSIQISFLDQKDIITKLIKIQSPLRALKDGGMNTVISGPWRQNCCTTIR